VVESSSLAAPLALHGGLRRRIGHRNMSRRAHSSAGRVRYRIASVGHLGHAHSAAIVLLVAARWGRPAVVGRHPELAMLIEDQTEWMKVVVGAYLLRVSELRLLVHGANNVRDPMSVLIDDSVNEVLTWEEMDSSAVQACQD
jgi:hypothetical protein